ncbi:MAG: hypothetical protein KA271_01975 [Propionivibrio sp.]|jgi:hypothetical protein|nr:hypothetical protein [Propionivibrio sp.]
METNTKAMTRTEIECANIELKSGCDALSAIANAIEVLSAIQPPPDKLFSHTITRLAAHAVYLADSMSNDVGCFIDQVEASA